MIVLRRKQFAWFNNISSAWTGISKQGRAAVMNQRKDYAAQLMKDNSNLSQTQANKMAADHYQLTKDMTRGQRFGAATKALGNTALLAGGTAVGAGALGIGAVNSMTGGVGKAVTGGMGDENSHGY